MDWLFILDINFAEEKGKHSIHLERKATIIPFTLSLSFALIGITLSFEYTKKKYEIIHFERSFAHIFLFSISAV